MQLRVATPLSLLAFFWLTMRAVVSAGGETLSSYGFPVAWYAPSPASSLAYDIAVGPMMLDVACYVLFGGCVLRLARWRPERNRTAGAVVSILLWVGALASLVFTAIVIAHDPHFVAWTLDGYFSGHAARSHYLQFGPGVRMQ
jgi:hypothetical protein